MKQITLFVLIFLLTLPLVACEKPKKNTFAPQTPQEFFDTVMEDFSSRTQYRRRVETYPDQEEGKIMDLYFSGIGTDGLTLSGEMTDKSNNTVSVIYGEGNLRGTGPGIGTSNRVDYLKTEAQPLLSLYAPSLEDGSMEEHLFNGFLRDYLSRAELTAEEDGSYTLSLHLEPTETLALYNMSSHKFLYTVDSDVVYTADKEGRLTSVTFYQENKELKKTQITLSYEPETHVKPRWFNKENPFESDGASSVGVTYDLGDKKQILLSREEEGLTLKPSATREGDGIITVPDHIPTDVLYNIGESLWVDQLILPQWSPEAEFYGHSGVDIFFVKGTRPQGETEDSFFFEGEWEMVNGVPKSTESH